MNKQALSHLFALFGGLNVLYSVSMWAITQGGFGLSELPGLDPRSRVTSSYFVIVLAGTLLTITAICAANYVLKVRAENRGKIESEKEPLIPRIALGEQGDYDPKSPLGILYQGVVILLFFLLPLGSLFHLNKVVAGRGVIWNEELPAGAALTASCLMPDYWPFGECAERSTPDGAMTVDIAYSAKDLADGEDKLHASGDSSRLWLANHWCDVYWARGMAGPQVEERGNCGPGADGFSADERQARKQDRLLLFDPLAPARITHFSNVNRPLPDVCSLSYRNNTCTGYTNRSENCEDSGKGCRGVQWIRIVSPSLIIAPSLTALLTTAGFFLLLSIDVKTWSASRRRPAPERNDVQGA